MIRPEEVIRTCVKLTRDLGEIQRDVEALHSKALYLIDKLHRDREEQRLVDEFPRSVERLQVQTQALRESNDKREEQRRRRKAELAAEGVAPTAEEARTEGVAPAADWEAPVKNWDPADWEGTAQDWRAEEDEDVVVDGVVVDVGEERWQDRFVREGMNKKYGDDDPDFADPTLD